MSFLAQVPAAIADTIQTVGVMATDALTDTGSAALAELIPSQPVETPELSIWELCVEGGWIMIPLAVLAIISIYKLSE